MEASKAEESSPALLAELSIRTLRLLSSLLLSLSTISSHPLFAILAAASLLAVLYLPRQLLPLLLSPVPISTFLLLSALLRFGSPPTEPPAAVAIAAASEEEERTAVCPEPKPDTEVESASYQQKVIFCDAFVYCGHRSGPLEVIYEEHEGEEEERAGGGSQEYPRWPQNADLGSGRMAPLGFVYTDSDTESDGGSPAESEAEGSRSTSLEEFLLEWENEEEETDDMIEIELEEEDNLIEIDIFGGR